MRVPDAALLHLACCTTGVNAFLHMEQGMVGISWARAMCAMVSSRHWQ